MDNEIPFVKGASKFNKIFQQLKGESEVEKKGDVGQFLGMNFTQQNITIRITQTYIINQFIKDIPLVDKASIYPNVPMQLSYILQRDKHEKNTMVHSSIIGLHDLISHVPCISVQRLLMTQEICM